MSYRADHTNVISACLNKYLKRQIHRNTIIQWGEIAGWVSSLNLLIVKFIPRILKKIIVFGTLKLRNRINVQKYTLFIKIV